MGRLVVSGPGNVMMIVDWYELLVGPYIVGRRIPMVPEFSDHC